MPGTPIRGESGCQAPPVDAPLPRRLGLRGVGFWLGDGKSEIRNSKFEID